MSQGNLYAGREQTLVKHFVLQKYLERFARIVGRHWSSITYVDCFAGPWKLRSPALKDSSFSIALEELRKARTTLADKFGRTLKLRCFFLEKDRLAFQQLHSFASGVRDAEIETRNCELESAIDDIVTFVKRGGDDSFPFVFIDPTGWSGFAMNAIAPLLRLEPGEVLINFMTEHIRRFIDSPLDETRESFESLFGSVDFRQRLLGLNPLDREDELVNAYAENVKKTGRFKYVCSAIVLHPEVDRTHFHLIYATRNFRGVEVFKDAEESAMAVQNLVRADAQQRTRQRKTGQLEMFPSDVGHKSSIFDQLRDRYIGVAESRVLAMLKSQGRVSYDDALLSAWRLPLVWESDLKLWVDDWVKSGRLKIEGMNPRQRVPKSGESNFLVWSAPLSGRTPTTS